MGVGNTNALEALVIGSEGEDALMRTRLAHSVEVHCCWRWLDTRTGVATDLAYDVATAWATCGCGTGGLDVCDTLHVSSISYSSVADLGSLITLRCK